MRVIDAGPEFMVWVVVCSIFYYIICIGCWSAQSIHLIAHVGGNLCVCLCVCVCHCIFVPFSQTTQKKPLYPAESQNPISPIHPNNKTKTKTKPYDVL